MEKDVSNLPNDRTPCFAQPTEKVGRYKMVKDLHYGPDSEQNMDVYLRSSNGTKAKKMTVIFLHGGGFYFSDKSKEEQFIRPYLENGFNVVNVNYRRRRGVATAVSDLPLAMSFLERHFSPDQLDLTQVVLTGFSAGAQIASLIGYGTAYQDFKYRLSSSIRIVAVVNIAGPVDKLNQVESGFLNHQQKQLREIGNSMFPNYPGSTPDSVLREYEAMSYFQPLKSGRPAFFLWYAGQDDQIPPNTFTEFIGKLQPEKDQVYFAKESGHVPQTKELAELYPKILAFLQTV